MWQARLRLVCLWCSQVSRIMADNCLRLYVVLSTAAAGAAQREAAWHLVAALLVFPSIFLAPLNGALSNSLPKRLVLVGSACFCLGVVVLFSLVGGGWLACLSLVAMGQALYSPTRYALLPAAAQDTHWPLTRVTGWIEMGSVVALVAGMMLGGYLKSEERRAESRGPEKSGELRAKCQEPVKSEERTLLSPGSWLSAPDSAGSWLSALGSPLFAVLLLNVIGVLTALPVSFRSDVFRPERPGRALAGFFGDSRRIWQLAEARNCLVALACLRGLVAAVTGAVIADALSRNAASGSAFDLVPLLQAAFFIMAGVAVGSVLAGVQGHPTRVLGLVPFGASGLCLGLAAAALLQPVPWWLCVFVGVCGGLVNVPLFATYQAGLPADTRGNAMAVLNTAGYVLMTGMSVLMTVLARTQVLDAAGQLWFVAVLAAVGAGVAWWALFRDSYEQVLELVFWPMFRTRGHGPGLEHIPRRGPLLIVANHAAWFDPIFLGKIVPRRLIAMLTSMFFDLPILNFLARKVVHAIRVPVSEYRREAPELAEAVAALDRGEVVLIFPEGQMRKREEQPLRQFGRGVWHILKERPRTPVMVCWIEGAWGSYTSYRGGRPTKNKRFDWWRRIDVAVSEPQLLDAALLEDHRTTRAYLMQQCLDARAYLGLPPLTVRPLPVEEPAITGEEETEE